MGLVGMEQGRVKVEVVVLDVEEADEEETEVLVGVEDVEEEEE